MALHKNWEKRGSNPVNGKMCWGPEPGADGCLFQFWCRSNSSLLGVSVELLYG